MAENPPETVTRLFIFIPLLSSNLFCWQSFKQQKAERARDLKIMEAYRQQCKTEGKLHGACFLLVGMVLKTQTSMIQNPLNWTVVIRWNQTA